MEEPSRPAKRQSLLMPKGTLSGLPTRSIPVANGLTRPRPMSMIGLDSNTARELSAMTAGAAPRPRAETSGPTTSKISRSVTSIAEEPRTGIARSGTLANGTSRLPATRKPLGHTRTLSYQRRSPTEDQLERNSPTRSRLPTNPSSLSRTNSVAKPPSRPSSALPTPSSSMSRPQSMLLPPSQRASFNTLQQHYSPRKTTAPKQSTAAILATTTAPTQSETAPIHSASAELAFHQTHLLHLTLLHESIPRTFNKWCLSARKSLARKFADATGHLSAVKESERESTLRTNVAALAEWGGGPDGSLGENVQALAGVVHETEVLLDDGGHGRVQGAVAGFGDWMECVVEMWSARDQGGGGVEFIDGLGEEWREECSGLVRRLQGLVGVLDNLERPREGSAVGDVLRLNRECLVGAIEELEMVGRMERMVVGLEDEWVERQLGSLFG